MPPTAFAAGQAGSNTIAGCGSFVTPDASHAPIPINSCTGPALFTTNIRASKTFGFGPSTGAKVSLEAPVGLQAADAVAVVAADAAAHSAAAATLARSTT